MKRVVLFLGAVAICTPLLANYPSPRIASRRAYDEKHGVGVMFGGRGPREKATGVIPGSTETWIWTGAQWSQRHPANHPSGRSAQMRVFDFPSVSVNDPSEVPFTRSMISTFSNAASRR